jgi:next-to-BRCA1 protein 1
MWALIHVLDQDEESPLVADSKAENSSPAPSAPAVPAPEKEPVNETSDDVKVIPVRGADVTTEETAVVVTSESPKSEPTNLGDDGFMKVEQSDTKSPEDSSPEETAIQAPAPTPLAADAPRTAGTASPEKAVPAAEDVSPEQVVPESVVGNKAPELYKEQLAKLAELGFDNGAQNVALLEKYDGDLPKTINDLVTVNEWDPMLQELEEMGFYDKELNRSLIYKNNGRLQRVVKDLVQIYKAGSKA